MSFTENTQKTQNKFSKKSILTLVSLLTVLTSLAIFLTLVVTPKIVETLQGPIEAYHRTCESIGGTYSGSIALGECTNKDGFVISISDKILITKDK